MSTSFRRPTGDENSNPTSSDKSATTGSSSSGNRLVLVPIPIDSISTASFAGIPPTTFNLEVPGSSSNQSIRQEGIVVNDPDIVLKDMMKRKIANNNDSSLANFVSKELKEKVERKDDTIAELIAASQALVASNDLLKKTFSAEIASLKESNAADIAGLKTEITGLKDSNTSLKESYSIEIAGLKTEITGLKDSNTSLKESNAIEIAGLKTEIASIKESHSTEIAGLTDLVETMNVGLQNICLKKVGDIALQMKAQGIKIQSLEAAKVQQSSSLRRYASQTKTLCWSVIPKWTADVRYHQCELARLQSKYGRMYFAARVVRHYESIRQTTANRKRLINVAEALAEDALEE